MPEKFQTNLKYHLQEGKTLGKHKTSQNCSPINQSSSYLLSASEVGFHLSFDY